MIETRKTNIKIMQKRYKYYLAAIFFLLRLLELCVMQLDRTDRPTVRLRDPREE